MWVMRKAERRKKMREWTMEKVQEYADVYTDYDSPWESHEIKLDMMENKEDESFLSTLTYNDFNEFVQQVINEVYRRIERGESKFVQLVDYTGYNY